MAPSLKWHALMPFPIKQQCLKGSGPAREVVFITEASMLLQQHTAGSVDHHLLLRQHDSGEKKHLFF